ncbi:MAG: hypothetical protein V6Z78_03735 [Holosporaceae bacterium]
MTSLKYHLCLLVLIFLSMPHASLRGHSPNLSELDDLTSHRTASAVHSILSAAIYPLDLLKKASLCAMKAPLFFLAATSALMPQAQATVMRHPAVHMPNHEIYPRVMCGLTSDWDTTTCVGRALNTTHQQHFLDNKQACRQKACAPRVDLICNDPKLRDWFPPEDVMARICDDRTCAPASVNSGTTRFITEEIKTCKEAACQQTGVAYSDHFTCLAPQNYTNDLSRGEQRNRAILNAEACFEPFCREHAQDTCPQEPSWWQSLFGISPCNEELCVGRFIPDEKREVVRGIFKSLQTIAHQAIQKCKGLEPYDGEPLTPIRLRRQQHEET